MSLVELVMDQQGARIILQALLDLLLAGVSSCCSCKLLVIMMLTMVVEGMQASKEAAYTVKGIEHAT